jgi:hypothetical protein
MITLLVFPSLIRECVGGQSSSFEVMEPSLEGPHGERVLEAALGVVWWVSIVSARELLGRFRDAWATESQAERPRMNCSLFHPSEVAKPPKSTLHALEIDHRPQRTVGAETGHLTRDVRWSDE